MRTKARLVVTLVVACALLYTEAATFNRKKADKDGEPSKAVSSDSQRMARATAGLLAGLLTSIVLQPLDVVKTRMQTRPGLADRNVLSVALEIFHTEGRRGLWAGTGASAVRLAGGIALYFLFLGEFEQLSKRLLGESLPAWAMAARDFGLGATARGVAGALFCPITVLKTRAEEGLIKSASGGLLGQLWALATSEGLAGLFAGLGPSLLSDIPYSGLSLLTLRLFREWLTQLTGGQLPPAIIGGVAGAGAAFCATTLTQPADMVRTALVVRGARGAAAAAKENSGLAGAGAAGGLATALQLIRSKGVGSLFAGTQARIVRRMLQQSFTWAVYDLVLVRRPR